MKTHGARFPRAKVATIAALPVWAMAASSCGLLAAIPVVPSIARGLLLAAFVFIAPGAAILAWARTLPGHTVAALVPVTGLAVTLIVTGAASMTGFWQPRATLAVMAAAACASGFLAARVTRREVTA